MDAITLDALVTDEALMQRYRDGDTVAFEVLYSRHKGGLYRYVQRQCNDPDIAQELFQDIWLSLIKHRHHYEVKAQFTTYLYRLAHNRLIDFYRKKRPESLRHYDVHKNPMIDDPPASESLMPDNVFEARQRARRLLVALQHLPEPQREAFLLREEAGLSVVGIAEVTGVPPETAKSRLRYATNKLRKAAEDAS